MGEQAEYEIWRRHGVDISADGRFESQRSRRRKNRERKIIDDHMADAVAYGFAKSPLVDLDFERLERSPQVYEYDICKMQPFSLLLQGPPDGWQLREKSLREQESWIDAGGTMIPLAKMETSYIKNCIGVARRSSKPYAEACARIMEEYLETQETKESEKAMNTKELINIMQLQNGGKLVGVRFISGDNGREYTYKWLGRETLGLGDLVVVEANNSYGLAKVSAPDQPVIGKDLSNLKHIISRVDLSAHADLLISEGAAHAKLQMAEVVSRLENYKKQFPGQVEAAARLLGVDASAGDDQLIEPEEKPKAKTRIQLSEGMTYDEKTGSILDADGDVVCTMAICE